MSRVRVLVTASGAMTRVSTGEAAGRPVVMTETYEPVRVTELEQPIGWALTLRHLTLAGQLVTDPADADAYAGQADLGLGPAWLDLEGP